jgi:ATP synthase protein I
MKNQKITELSNKIDIKLKGQDKSHAKTPLGASTKIATDLVSGLLVGVVIGLMLDKWLETKPLFLIICLLVGVIAAIKNIMISLKQKNAE